MAITLTPVSVLAASATPGQLYQKYCSACHGEKGNGQSRAINALNPPPRNFTDPVVRQSLTRERMITSVTHGRPGTAMVAWDNRLSAGQIEGIVDYIRANFMQAQAATDATPATPSPHARPTTPASRAGPGSNSRRVIPVNASVGERIYINNCAVCHGDKGAGAMWTQATFNPPPRKFASLQSREELTRERMITSVTHGRPDTAMMPFRPRLSDQEIAAVVDYIRDSFMSDKAIAEAAAAASTSDSGTMPSHGHGGAGKKEVAEMPKPKPAPTVDTDMSLPFPGGLSGDSAKGRDFYVANCFTCHGKAGDGEGPRSTFIRPKPRNFLHPDARRTLNRPTLFKAITNGKAGTVMPAWGKVLNDQEIADVAEFVFQEFIRADEQKKKVSRN